MHLAILTRGIKNDVDRWVEELSSRYLPFKWKSKEMKEHQEKFLQVRVSPIQLWDISFPAEHKQLMLNTIFGENKGKPMSTKLNKFIWWLRKLMGFTKTEWELTDSRIVMYPGEHTEKILIGEKPDEWHEGFEQI